jgi:soluble lytic murein transglycosylase-like protein
MDSINNTTGAGTQSVKPDKMDAKSKVRLQHAVQDFESVFVGYLLKTMRQSVPKAEGEDEGGFGGEMMESVFDAELAKHISRNSSLGLAEMMYKKLTGEPLPKTQDQLIPSKAHTVHAISAAVTASAAPPPASPTAVRARKSVQPVSQQPSVKNVTLAADTLQDRLNGLTDLISSAAQQHGLNPNLVKAIIATESAGIPRARSSQNAKGLMQLVDSTATAMGVNDVWDPQQNIQGGTKYLKMMMERFGGDVKLALASYNAGPAAVEKHGGVPPYKETQKYVKRVMDYLNYFNGQESGANEEN